MDTYREAREVAAKYLRDLHGPNSPMDRAKPRLGARHRSVISIAEQIRMMDLASYGIPVSEIVRLVGRGTSSVYGIFNGLGVAVHPPSRTPAQIHAAMKQLVDGRGAEAKTRVPAPAPAPAPVSETPPKSAPTPPKTAPTPPARPLTAGQQLAGRIRRAAEAMGARIVEPLGSAPEAPSSSQDMAALVAELRRRIAEILVVLAEAEGNKSRTD